MSTKLYRFALLLAFLPLLACGSKEKEDTKMDSEIYTPSISDKFEIRGTEESANTLIRVKNPWQDALGIDKELLIVRDSVSSVDYEGSYLNGEARRIVCMSSTHVAMLDALGAADRIVGVSGMPYISNRYVRENQSRIPDVGYEGNMDYETLLGAHPDLVLLYSINGESAIEKKLKEFGIPFLYVGDYVEEDPLGKAEWVIPIAEVIGKREEGIKLFNDICKRYNAMKEKVADSNLNRPKVMLNAPIGDSWFMPSVKSYVARMMEDAGAEYVFKKETVSGSIPIDIEEAYLLEEQADFWLNPGGMKSLEELKATFPKFGETKTVKAEKVYNNNRLTSPGGGNDCFESGVVNPDLILRDLIKIFHPDLIEEDFVYYQKLN